MGIMENMESVLGVFMGLAAAFSMVIFLFGVVLYVLQGMGLMRVVETNDLSSKYKVFGWIPVLSMYVYILIGMGTPSEDASRRKAKIITCVMLVLPAITQVLQTIFILAADGTSSVFVGLISVLVMFGYWIFSIVLLNNYMKAFGAESSKRILYSILAIFTLGLVQAVFIFRHRNDELAYEQKIASV